MADPDSSAPPEGGGQHAAAEQPDPSPSGAVLAATSSAGTPRSPFEVETAVLDEDGDRIVSLRDDWTATAFNYTFASGTDDAKPVSVTNAGLRVTEEHADELVASAAAHGVRLTVEDAEPAEDDAEADTKATTTRKGTSK